MSQSVQPSAEQFLALTLENDTAATVELFEQAGNWQERYRQIMLLGKSLPKLDDNLRVESAQVRGCESNAWLYHSEIDGKHYFIADSDARIVKGLIALLLIACNGKTSNEIGAFSPDCYFTQLGLQGQLSPSRTNGLLALAKAIKVAAE
ncbi:SufE family protein [Shewanella schlegeliana]|uniref:SufE family protein n=1 Tax=Shewanella schlegeliana TaxID=190308 RepID=A0ABS1SYS4_9GAMM|nr:SufE family protein [Shewanella schlegeliana]MBL4912441.1 SufE family protein [Shewanella schlegeliana]MCL1108089.1 SufE family protein [Shewanella schlegeliana]GIU21739.1 Fe-S metabolism protein SufE [Shewanella schlegeliana]